MTQEFSCIEIKISTSQLIGITQERFISSFYTEGHVYLPNAISPDVTTCDSYRDLNQLPDIKFMVLCEPVSHEETLFSYTIVQKVNLLKFFLLIIGSNGNLGIK